MDKKEKKKNNKKSFIWLMSVCFIAVSLLVFCQFYFGDSISDKTTFYNQTFVNGIDVSGLTKTEAENLLLESFANDKDKINITLTSGDKSWQIKGEDHALVGNFDSSLDKILEYGHEGNIFAKKKIENNIKKNGLNLDLPFEDMVSGVEEKISVACAEIETNPVQSRISFNPDSEQMFTVNTSKKGYVVDRDALDKKIRQAIARPGDYEIEIPLQEIVPSENLEDLVSQISLRGRFSTNYTKSSQNRKNNIKKALSSFNGLIVEPGKTISFNQQTGPRNEANGYKNAKIIVEGSYVSGIAGGVCQASTTLYNALLLSDIEVLQANHHSLPASYVPLSFDAMVSEGYADLVFKNNLDTPIYIKAYGTDNDAVVEIYGQPLEEGLTIQTRSELVKVIPHGGDSIIKDSRGEFSNRVLYQGEYYRLKYPQEGYESKGYVQYLKDGKIIDEKEIRHDHYQAQKGIIVEGSATLEDGMTLPEGNVKYISPQKVTKETTENAKKRWKAT